MTPEALKTFRYLQVNRDCTSCKHRDDSFEVEFRGQFIPACDKNNYDAAYGTYMKVANECRFFGFVSWALNDS